MNNAHTLISDLLDDAGRHVECVVFESEDFQAYLKLLRRAIQPFPCADCNGKTFTMDEVWTCRRCGSSTPSTWMLPERLRQAAKGCNKGGRTRIAMIEAADTIDAILTARRAGGAA